MIIPALQPATHPENRPHTTSTVSSKIEEPGEIRVSYARQQRLKYPFYHNILLSQLFEIDISSVRPSIETKNEASVLPDVEDTAKDAMDRLLSFLNQHNQLHVKPAVQPLKTICCDASTLLQGQKTQTFGIEHDVIIRMPPKMRRIVRVRVKRITKGELKVVEP